MTEASKFAASAAFWDAFAKEAWGLGPRVYTAPSREPMISQEEVLGVIRASTSAPSPALWFQIGGETARLETVASPAEFETVNAWVRAVKRSARDAQRADVFLYVPDVQTKNRDVYFRARAFVGPLLRKIGLPGECANIDLFIGDYSATPSSIHRDGHNFTFPLSGKKTLHFWPFETIAKELSPSELVAARQEPSFFARSLRKRPETLAHYAKTAIQVVVEPGQFVYWPSSYWHCAAGDGSIAETFSIALYPFDTSVSSALKAEAFGTGERVDFYPCENGSSPPSAWYASVDRLEQSLVAALDRLRARGPADWALRASAGGFRPAPEVRPSAEARITASTKLRGDRDFPPRLIERIQTPFGALVNVASCGHPLTIKEPREGSVVERLIALAASGECFRIGQAFEAASPSELEFAVLVAEQLVSKLGLFAEQGGESGCHGQET